MKLLQAIIVAYDEHGRREHDWIVEDRGAGLSLTCKYRDDPTAAGRPAYSDYVTRGKVERIGGRNVTREDRFPDLEGALAWLANEDAYAFERGEHWQVSYPERAAKRNVEDDDGMLHWFGSSWGAPLNAECPEEPTPVGWVCQFCRRPIRKDDQGVTMLHIEDTGSIRRPWHRACFARACGEKGVV